jgi:very-short-patch-repair endonuclease
MITKDGTDLSDPAGSLSSVTNLAVPSGRNTKALNDDGLWRILRRQGLVVTRAQALACGMTPEALRHRIRAGGPWQRLVPGVYLTVTGTPTLLQMEIAALLYGGHGSVITSLTALRRYGIRVPGVTSIAVLVPASHAHRSRAFVRIQPTVRMPDRFCHEGAVRFALPARAVADAAQELDSFRHVRALVADVVQQRRCKLDSLFDELANGPVRGSAWLRRSLLEVASGIRSGAEGDFADLLRRSELPAPMFNAHLYDGRTFIAIADAWWADAGVAVEVDSREWHISPEDWQRTLRRHSRMSARGIIVLHVTPAQVRDEPARVLADIASALVAGRARPTLAIRAVPSGS